MENNVKKAKTLMDEFAPSEYKVPFWSLPQSIAAHEKLSAGAKLLYATLLTLGQKHNNAFATQATLSGYLGKPSISTLRRWQNELVSEGFIRVLQKGRGLSNNYYFLRHPVLGNAEEGEFEEGPRYLYRSKKYGTQTIVSEDDARFIFKQEVQEWYDDALNGNVQPFPKPSWPFNRTKYSEYRKDWIQRLDEQVGLT